jgi:hypothetical protein
VRSRIVVAGSIAQKPWHGGHSWVLLQYVLGLERLGWEVLLLDRIDPAMWVDDLGRPSEPAQSRNLRYFRCVADGFGLSARCALFAGNGGGARESIFGIDRRRAVERVREAELLIDVMGFLDDEEISAAARRRVFLDIDPGFPQIWRELGLADLLSGYDDFVTVGANLGRPECALPDCGLSWIAIRPPVVLDEWPVEPALDAPFTSVATWRGRFAPLEWRGETYGLRAHELRKFAELPARSGLEFELALDIDSGDERDRELLAAGGWRLVDPKEAAPDPWSYRDFIARSGAEFMVAKDTYVRSHSGWFSDRTACYLASGRPAVVRDTGLDGTLPDGEGLFVFRTFDEALDAVGRASRDRARQGRAARRIAEELFDSDKVLGGLLDALGVGAP